MPNEPPDDMSGPPSVARSSRKREYPSSRCGLFELLPRHPIVSVASVMKLVETTKPTAGRAIELLVAANVLVETTGKKRDRSFVYRPIGPASSR